MSDTSISESSSSYNYRSEYINKHEEFLNSKSYLSADAIRWMNKRRPGAGTSSTMHILPSRALQLRQIFKGLDFDNSGSIDIEELKEAVNFVARKDKSSDKVIQDPKKLTEFFVTMDTDGNGTVDLNEFMVGMSEAGGESTEGTAKLQQAFFDFANRHRRQLLLNEIGPDGTMNELSKYTQLKHLFAISYFKDEVSDVSLEDKLRRAHEDAERDAQELNTTGARKIRLSELRRARKSALFFQQQKAAFEGKPDPIYNSLSNEGVPRARQVADVIESRLVDGASRFPIARVNTFVPGESRYMLEPSTVSYLPRSSQKQQKQQQKQQQQQQHHQSVSSKSLLLGSSSSLSSTLAGAGATAIAMHAGADSHRMHVKRDLAATRMARSMVDPVAMAAHKPTSVRRAHLSIGFDDASM